MKFCPQNERRCECLPGYLGNGVQCLEKVVPPVDRCLEDNGGCDPAADCKDLHYHGNASLLTSITTAITTATHLGGTSGCCHVCRVDSTAVDL